MDNEIITCLVENNGEDAISSHINGMMHEAYSEHFIGDFITAFENNKRKTSISRKNKNKNENLIKFTEDYENANTDADAT